VDRGSSSGKQLAQSTRSLRALEVDIRWRTVPSHSGFFVLWQTSASRPSSSGQPAALAQTTRGCQAAVGARVVEVGRASGAAGGASSVNVCGGRGTIGEPPQCLIPRLTSSFQLSRSLYAEIIRFKQMIWRSLRRPRQAGSLPPCFPGFLGHSSSGTFGQFKPRPSRWANPLVSASLRRADVTARVASNRLRSLRQRSGKMLSAGGAIIGWRRRQLKALACSPSTHAKNGLFL